MIRVVVFLAVVGLIALGVAWVAERPGEVSLVWMGWRIETSLMVLLAAVAAFAVVAMLLFSGLRGLWRSPARAAEALRRRREAKVRHAITRGLVAVGSGDARAARRFADDVGKLGTEEPLALLLAAQSAQLNGDRAGAERAFREMTAHPQTRVLGLRGLFIEAQRSNDLQKASLYAEEAAKLSPSLPWAGQAVLQLRCAGGDWAGALEMLERNRSSGTLDRAAFRRQRAVLLTAHALSLEESDRNASKALAIEAAKLAPELIPAAALAGRYLAEDGDLRKASRMIERAWQSAPHPDLAETYAYLRYGDSARDRLARVQKLAALKPSHPESALALARAAIDAREFEVARRAMQPLVARPTQRAALLMAALERADTADEGRVREWTARAVHAARDPAWTADGYVSERWLPFSPVSGRIDAFEWKAPLEEIGYRPMPMEDAEETRQELAHHGSQESAQETGQVSAQETGQESGQVTVREAAQETVREAPQPEPQQKPKEAAAPLIEVTPPPPPAPERQPAAEPVAEAAPVPSSARPAVKSVPRIETVVPITHVPDDPGPEADREGQLPDHASSAPGWKRLFH